MADAALEPGRILAGKYRLGERLGEGGMGAVYRAEHLVLQAPVAIKVIERELADEGTKARFMREAQAAAALRSPHVVQILDYGTEADIPFMVMELLEGETLARRIKRKRRLSPQETSWILTHVGRAVAKAHELGVVHRDLKPDNVFLVRNEEDEIAKVLDFGVAKIEATNLTGDSHTRTGSLLGTPYYMSPEQAQGNKAIDHRSDLWALGVIAFECLTGKRPFASDGLGDLVLQICIRDLPVPSALASVPIGFDPWFAKAVQREPDERFQSAKELTDALREALGTSESASVPDILVTSASPSTPSPPGTSSDEDARPTAVEGGPVDAAAETIAEELLPGTLAALRRATTLSAVDGANAPQPEAGQPPLSVSLHDVSAAQVSSAGKQSAAPRRRSNAGLFFAVGFSALAAGVLVAVLAVGGRPGFRVGDIEGPAEKRPGTRNVQSAARGPTDKGAEGASASARSPRDTSGASRSGRTSSDGDDDDSPPIDGRSILDTSGDSTTGSDSTKEGTDATSEGASSDLNGDADSKPDGKTEDTKATEPGDTKPTDGKPADTKAPAPKADTKPADPKPSDPPETKVDPPPADSPETKSPAPKAPETKSPETKSPETKSPETKSEPPPSDTPPEAKPEPTEAQPADRLSEPLPDPATDSPSIPAP